MVNPNSSKESMFKIQEETAFTWTLDLPYLCSCWWWGVQCRENQLKTCKNGVGSKHSMTVSNKLNMHFLSGSSGAQLPYFKNVVRSLNIFSKSHDFWGWISPGRAYCSSVCIPEPSTHSSQWVAVGKPPLPCQEASCSVASCHIPWGIPVGTGSHTAERKGKRCNWDETKDFFFLTEAACCKYTLLTQTHSRWIGHNI